MLVLVNIRVVSLSFVEIMFAYVMFVREGQLALQFPGDGALVPVVASEVSGTALAAALLRDGWSVSETILGLRSSHYIGYVVSPRIRAVLL